MKRIVALVMALVMLSTIALTLASCGEKAKCVVCGKEKLVSGMEKSELFGKEVYTCKKCIKEAEDALKDIGDALK